MATTRKSPRDLTGTIKERREAEVATERLEAAERLAMSSAVASRSGPSRVSYDKNSTHHGDKTPEQEAAERTAAERAGEPEEVLPETVWIRVNSPIEQMTFGREVIEAGDLSDPENPKYPVLGSLHEWNMKEGVEYEVPYALYLHLDELGYVYH